MPTQHPYKKQDDATPFLDLLSDAEQIQIREVSASNRQRILSTLDRFTQEVTGGKDKDRIFFVHLKERDAIQEAIAAAPDRTPISKDKTYLLQNAKILLENNELILARNVYSYILKEDLKNAEALLGLGRCLMGLGQATAARKCFRAAWEWSNSQESLYWLAQCYLKDGLDELATKYLKRIENIETLSDEIRFGVFKDLGNCYLRSNEAEQARDAYQKALGIRPDSEVVQVNLGTLDLQLGNLSNALERFETVVEKQPTNSKALCGIGMVKAKAGREDEAREAFTRAIAIDPLSTVALFHLYELADKSGELGEVEGLMKNFIEKAPKNNDVRYALATIQYRQGKWTACEDNLNQVLTQDPKHTKAGKLLGELISNRHRR